MLTNARLQALVLTSDMARARDFYTNVLGLTLKGESLGALVYDVGAGDLRLSPVPSTQPSEHTVLGFAVEDIDGVVDQLARHGLRPERFAHFTHDARGLWTGPDGTRVIWFRDPDGNLFSVVQYPD